jgi:predicted transcriptional regulator
MVKTIGDVANGLCTGQRLLSKNGHFEFIGKPNGDFCIHQLVGKKTEIWHPDGKRWGKAAKHGVKHTQFVAQRTDGNIVFYVHSPHGKARAVWSSCTTKHGTNKNRLKLHNNGLLVAYKDINDSKSSYWSTGIKIDTSFYTEKEKLEKELKNFNNIVEVLNNKLATANATIKTLNSEINKLTKENNELRKTVNNLNDKMKVIVKDSANLQKNIAIIQQYTDGNDKLNNRVKLLEDKVQSLTNILAKKTEHESEMKNTRNKMDLVANLLNKLVKLH